MISQTVVELFMLNVGGALLWARISDCKVQSKLNSDHLAALWLTVTGFALEFKFPLLEFSDKMSCNF